MSGARYQKVTCNQPTGFVTPAFPAPYTVYPSTNAADLSLTDDNSLNLRGVRSAQVVMCGPGGAEAASGALRAYLLTPTNLLINKTPEAVTRRWVRAPLLDVQNFGATRDVFGVFSIENLGIVGDRVCWLPEALVYSDGTDLSFLLSARYWGT